jgi:hypothetical protein
MALRVSEAQLALLLAARTDSLPTTGPSVPRAPKRQRTRKERAALPENQIEKVCLDWLRVNGWYAVRLLAGVFKSLDGRRYVKAAEAGIPDWLVLRGDEYMLVEFKAKRGRAEISQTKWRLLADTLGLRHAVVRSIEDLKDWGRR